MVNFEHEQKSYRSINNLKCPTSKSNTGCNKNTDVRIKIIDSTSHLELGVGRKLMSGHFADLKIFPGFSNSADVPRDICGHIPLIDPECVSAFKQGIRHVTLLDFVKCQICLKECSVSSEVR